jgi:hypothetical protein
MPGLNSTTVLCAKDLKPVISRRFKRIMHFYPGKLWDFLRARPSRNIPQLRWNCQGKITIYSAGKNFLTQDIGGPARAR